MTGCCDPASGHFLTDASRDHLTVEIGQSAFEADDTRRRSEDRMLDPVLCPVKGYNGSISWGPLFKPHDRLKLTLLAIFIDIATL